MERRRLAGLPALLARRIEGMSISICLLGIPWMAIWPADLPRIEGITASR